MLRKAQAAMPPTKSFDYDSVSWYEKYPSKGGGTASASAPSVFLSQKGRLTINEPAFAVFGFAEDEADKGLLVGVHRGRGDNVTLVVKRPDDFERGLHRGNLLKPTKVGKRQSLNTIKYLTDNGLQEFFGNDYEGPETDEANHALRFTLNKA